MFIYMCSQLSVIHSEAVTYGLDYTNRMEKIYIEKEVI